jgi:hypothetical protein
MKFISPILASVLLFGCSSSNLKTDSLSSPIKTPCSESIKVVELKDYSFTGSSFLDDRNDLTYTEADATEPFKAWAKDAVTKVNALIPQDARLCEVKFKLIFQASIKDPKKKISQTVPISIIESYQEPKTNSVRLGMFEITSDEASFKDIVAHEYTHLVFESLSRKVGTTAPEADGIKFWPKSVYEGLADLIASLAMDTSVLGSKDNWSSRDLNEFSSLEQAQKSKAQIVSKARASFKKAGLIPKYALYNDWLKKVDHFINASGGVDPYAEGVWLAGALRKEANTPVKVSKLVDVLTTHAKSGMPFTDTKDFYNDVIVKMKQ